MKARDTQAALRAARELLADPTRFTQSHTARNRRGYPVIATARTAVQWDASGALMRVTGQRSRCPGFAELVAAAGGFRLFVDRTTRGRHADVLALFDRAIAGGVREAM